MVNIHPATVIIIRGFGTDASDKQASEIRISGWMDEDDPGSGQLLWTGAAILGNNQWAAAGVPTLSKLKRWTSAQYFEVDTWTPGTDYVGCAEIASSDKHSALIVPTLGYTNILAEIGGGTFTVAALGLVWRPLCAGNSAQSTLAIPNS